MYALQKAAEALKMSGNVETRNVTAGEVANYACV